MTLLLLRGDCHAISVSLSPYSSVNLKKLKDVLASMKAQYLHAILISLSRSSSVNLKMLKDVVASMKARTVTLF